MTPESIQALAAGEREFVHDCGNGWKLRARVPSPALARRTSLAEGVDTSAAMLATGERLAIESVLSWDGVTMAHIGLRGLAGVDENAPAPCTLPIVRALLEDHLDVLDGFREALMERYNARRKSLEADEGNSDSV